MSEPAETSGRGRGRGRGRGSRGGRRKSPRPQLQWVTATNPQDFKNATSMKNVRSHVMAKYCHEQRVKQTTGAPLPTANLASHPSHPQSHPREIISPPISPAAASIPEFDAVSPVSSAHSSCESRKSSLDFPSAQSQSATSVSSNESTHDRSMTCWTGTLDFGEEKPTIINDAITASPMEEDDNNQNPFDNAVAATPQHRTRILWWNGHSNADPFYMLPQSRHKEIDVVALKKVCCRTFVKSDNMINVWMPMVLRDSATFISSICISSVYRDIMDGYVDDSQRTTTIKGEALALINERLTDPKKQTDDLTMASICQVICGDIMSADDRTLGFHERGLELMATQRGGLYSLGISGQLSVLLTVLILNINIFKESQPNHIFLDFMPPIPTQIRKANAAKYYPESPVYCPTPDLLFRSPGCSDRTWALLSSMRKLTDICIEYGTLLQQIQSQSNPTSTTQTPGFISSLTNQTNPISQILTYERTIQSIYHSVLTLPSAHDPLTTPPENSLYESIRLASLIYSHALSHRIPLSRAAAAASLYESQKHVHRASMTNIPLLSTPDYFIPAAIHAALLRTDHSDVWGDMKGVFWWVCAIGASAARNPSNHNESSSYFPSSHSPISRSASVSSSSPSSTTKTAPTQPPRSMSLGSEAQQERNRVSDPHADVGGAWTRKRLLMFTQHASIVVGFEFPAELVAMQQRFLRVQGLCAGGLSAGGF